MGEVSRGGQKLSCRDHTYTLCASRHAMPYAYVSRIVPHAHMNNNAAIYVHLTGRHLWWPGMNVRCMDQDLGQPREISTTSHTGRSYTEIDACNKHCFHSRNMQQHYYCFGDGRCYSNSTCSNCVAVAHVSATATATARARLQPLSELKLWSVGPPSFTWRVSASAARFFQLSAAAVTRLK